MRATLNCGVALVLVVTLVAGQEVQVGRNWGPEQAIGAPDTAEAGDWPTAWASRSQDSQEEWLLVEFERGVVPSAVRVFESFNPGALRAVNVFGPGGEELEVWRGVDPTLSSLESGISLVPLKTNLVTKKIRLVLDSERVKGWNEIDAVGLHGANGDMQWAVSASASSTFADGETGTPAGVLELWERRRLRELGEPGLGEQGESGAEVIALDALPAKYATVADGLLGVLLQLDESAGAARGDLVEEILAMQRRPLALAEVVSFEGLWSSSFGALRLTIEGKAAYGVYPLGVLSGRVDGRRLTFSYEEELASGEGWFELAEDGSSFEGNWHVTSAEEQGVWRRWLGQRVQRKDQDWLVILEAPWQTGLMDREYSFGEMLRAIFDRRDGLAVRHRFFTDAQSFRTYCEEAALLPGDVTLVVASHGTTEGLGSQEGLVSNQAVAEALSRMDNLSFVHFSSCNIMAGELPSVVWANRPVSDQLKAISGYEVTVDWMASALSEFTLLDLVLNRGLEPAEAGEQLLKALDFADGQVRLGSAIPAAHFRLEVAPGSGADRDL